MARGKFITLEGGEGAGKSTQVRFLTDFLAATGHRVVTTREIGGAPGAEEIRTLWLDKGEGFWDPMTELMLTMAARRDHLAKTVWPALDAGAWVVSDRFVDSARAYQGIGLELGIAKVDAVYHMIADDFWPDLTLFLDVPAELGLERMRARRGADDRYQQKNVAFHETLRMTYRQLALSEPRRIKIIDATPSPDQVAAALVAAVQRAFDAPQEA
jgi:dTMP kinase